MSRNGRPLEHRALSILKWTVSCFLFLMMGITFVDVLGRYVFNAPIFGAAEMIQFLLAVTVFSGLVLASLQDSHIAVTIFLPKIRKRIPFGHDLAVAMFSAGGLLLIAIEFARISFHALMINRTTIVLEWPIALVSVPSTFFCIAAAVVQMMWLYRRWS